MQDNFNFDIISEFPGYNSSRDKTNIKAGYLVRGSQNVYKKISGTIANRPGLLKRGASDSTSVGVVASFEWKCGRGITIPLRVCNNKLQFESKISDGSNPLWYDLLETSTLVNPAATLSYFVFAPWYEYFETKDRIIMVRRDANILHWSGGITKVATGTAAGGTGAILTYVLNAGTGYAVGEYIFVGGAGNGGVFRVDTISGTGAPTAISILSAGSGYVAASGIATTSSGRGSGSTMDISVVTTCSTLGKLDTSTTWKQNGFASRYPLEKKFILNGVEYTYTSGEDTNILKGVTPDPSAIVSGGIAIQSVIVSASDPFPGTTPAAHTSNDMVSVVEGQAFMASYTSQLIKISARTTNRSLGFLDYVNIDSLISGDPDFAIIDSPPKGLAPKDGKMYIPAGTSDWYIITPNTPVPVSFTSAISGTTTAFVLTKVEKIAGTGLVAAKSHEFIDSVGGDIVYLAQDNQVRTFSTSTRSVFTKKLPSFSQWLQDELHDEDFTGGHLRAIGEFVYVTAPIAGRHYMYQIRESMDEQGNVVAERIWHPPQISGISRFAEIDGVTYGHSNANPMIYKVWDTNQWHDDGPDSQELSYTSVARIAYTHVRNSKGGYDYVGTGVFDKVYFEGYITEGSNVYGNVYFDYKGAGGIQNVIINSIESPATFYTGSQSLGIGASSLGDNPLGDGLVPESNDQALMPKVRCILDIGQTESFENELEIYSVDADSRWEMLRIGTNLVDNGTYPVEIRKSS